MGGGMDCTQGQVRPHKTLKCVILEPGPGAEVKIAKPGKQCTGTPGPASQTSSIEG